MLINIIRILLILLLSYGSVELYIGKSYILMFILLIPLIILLYQIIVDNGRVEYPVIIHKPYDYLNHINVQDDKVNEEVIKKCSINKNVIQMENVVTESIPPQLPPIKTLVEIDLNKKQEKDIIDGTKNNKPTIDINKALMPKQVSTMSVSTTAKEVILVNNSRNLDKEKETIYNVIISVLSEQNLLSDKKYALFQSFAYIDNTTDAIVLYIDYGILYKAKLTTVHLKQFDIISEIRKKLNKPNFKIIFAEYKAKSLLNYVLETKK